MNWETLLSSMVGLLTALGGWEAVKYFMNRKSNMRICEAEADKMETEADAIKFRLYEDRIKELRQANVEINEQNIELIKAGARKDDIIEDKTAKIRELQDARVNDTRTIGRLEKELIFHKNWFCRREYGKGKGDCTRREPQQNPPMKFKPFSDD